DLQAATGSLVSALTNYDSPAATVERVGCQLDPSRLNRFGQPSGWGWYVRTRDAAGARVLYAHLETSLTSPVPCEVLPGGGTTAVPVGAAFPSVGSTLHRGDRVGYSDSSGGVTGPHLHVELLPDGKTQLNPFPCLDSCAQGCCMGTSGTSLGY